MTSKYDRFWKARLRELRVLLSRCDEGGKMDVSQILHWGNRRSWYGNVEVGKYAQPRSQEAHMKSLGRVIKEMGLLNGFPYETFILTMSSDGRTLTCKGKDKVHGQLATSKKKERVRVMDDGLGAIKLAIEFLDEARWANDYNYLYAWPETVDMYKRMNPSKRALVHLLAYLSNAMIDAAKVWNDFVPNDVLLVDEYCNLSSSEQVADLVDSYSNRIAGGLGKGMALNAIKTALIQLKGKFEGNFLLFIEKAITGSYTKEEKLFDVEALELKFFDLVNAKFIKRIRCIIRDYKKWSVFKDLSPSLSGEPKRIWDDSFRPEQLRLPPDSQVMKALTNLSGQPFAGQMAKNLPEPFDVLWQVGRDMCPGQNGAGQCDICFFGKGGVFQVAKCPSPGNRCESIFALFKWEAICPGACPLPGVKKSCKTN